MINAEEVPYIGEWSELRKKYLIEEKPADYEELVESKLLIEYFAGYEEMCRKRFDELVEEQMEHEGINEEMKSRNPLEWVSWVNNIRSQVREILTAEICS